MRRGVGRNLQDHCGLTISKFVNVPTYNSESSGLHAARHLSTISRSSGARSPPPRCRRWAGRAAMLARRARHPPELAAVRHRLHGVAARDAQAAVRESRHLRFAAAQSRRDSPEVRRTPVDKPVIDHRLVGDERDVATIKRAIGLMERIFTMPALAGRSRRRLQSCQAARDRRGDGAISCGQRRHRLSRRRHVPHGSGRRGRGRSIACACEASTHCE